MLDAFLTHHQSDDMPAFTNGMPPFSRPCPIESFLASFVLLSEKFLAVCQPYFRGEATLDTITRALSETTADPEHAFAQYSHQMSMDQLQRYGQVQARIDSMMERIFSEEIQRNRQILAKAIENGEYFLLNVIGRSIVSAIYMRHSKERIQTERQQRLAAFESEERSLQAMVKVIKALEQTLQMPPEPSSLRRIELALGLYVDYFASLTRTELLSACDNRVRLLIKQHLKALSALPLDFGSDEHLRHCFEHLAGLPAQPRTPQAMPDKGRTRPALAYESAFAA